MTVNTDQPVVPMVLPPGTTKETFTAFIHAVVEVVGSDSVTIIRSKEDLIDGTYENPVHTHDIYHVMDKDYLVASAVVLPAKVPDVQEIVRLAGKFQIPLWPTSIGRNVGYGGAAPRLPGSVVLNLGAKMNRVLEVNVDEAFALVEPGVTFAGLYDHLVKNNLQDKVWIDVCLPDYGSQLNFLCVRIMLEYTNMRRPEGPRYRRRFSFGEYPRPWSGIHPIWRSVEYILDKSFVS